MWQVREGRPLEVNQELIQTIVASCSKITGQPAKEVLAGLSEINSDMTMDYGLILPHPGGERVVRQECRRPGRHQRHRPVTRSPRDRN
jgi:hypothetical protein